MSTFVCWDHMEHDNALATPTYEADSYGEAAELFAHEFFDLQAVVDGEGVTIAVDGPEGIKRMQVTATLVYESKELTDAD